MGRGVKGIAKATPPPPGEFEPDISCFGLAEACMGFSWFLGVEEFFNYRISTL